MSKRFTDSDKWRDEWWGSLPNDYRMIWLYLIDHCSIAGIWKKDLRGLNFNCNTSVTESDLVDLMAGRLVDCGKFFFIPSYIKFQYSNGLASNKPMILSVVKELTENNLLGIVKERLGNDYPIIKVMVREKEMVKEKEKEKEKEKGVQGEKQRSAEAAEVITHLNDLNGTKLRTDTKATVKHIAARIREGFTVQELKEIVEYKTAEWKGTEFEKYIQPDTLFNAENCAKYRNQVQRAKDTGMTLNQIKGKKQGPNEGLAERVAALYRERIERERSDNVQTAGT